MTIPHIIFGKCNRCGGTGDDYPASELTSADAQDNIVTGNGLYLEFYDGDYYCKRCVGELKADEESRIAADKHADAESFRSNAGFKKTI